MSSSITNSKTTISKSGSVGAGLKPNVAGPRQRLTSVSSDLSSGSKTETSNGDHAKPAKKLPPIKAPVGLAKGPDLSNCKSKVGSLANIKHSPISSGVVIPSQKLEWRAKSKVGSLDNKEHKPGGGRLQIESRKLEWNTTSKVQSLDNVKHKPGGGKVKIFNETYAQKRSTTPKVDGDNKAEVSKQQLSQNMNNLKLLD